MSSKLGAFIDVHFGKIRSRLETLSSHCIEHTPACKSRSHQDSSKTTATLQLTMSSSSHHETRLDNPGTTVSDEDRRVAFTSVLSAMSSLHSDAAVVQGMPQTTWSGSIDAHIVRFRLFLEKAEKMLELAMQDYHFAHDSDHVVLRKTFQLQKSRPSLTTAEYDRMEGKFCWHSPCDYKGHERSESLLAVCRQISKIFTYRVWQCVDPT